LTVPDWKRKLMRYTCQHNKQPKAVNGSTSIFRE